MSRRIEIQLGDEQFNPAMFSADELAALLADLFDAVDYEATASSQFMPLDLDAPTMSLVEVRAASCHFTLEVSDWASDAAERVAEAVRSRRMRELALPDQTAICRAINRIAIKR